MRQEVNYSKFNVCEWLFYNYFLGICPFYKNENNCLNWNFHYNSFTQYSKRRKLLINVSEGIIRFICIRIWCIRFWKHWSLADWSQKLEYERKHVLPSNISSAPLITIRILLINQRFFNVYLGSWWMFLQETRVF